MTSAQYMLARPSLHHHNHHNLDGAHDRVSSKMPSSPDDPPLLNRFSSRSSEIPPIDPSSSLDPALPPPSPPPPPPAGAAIPLLDDRESLAYSNFLDKIALDSDFIFDPVLPEDLLPWPHQQSSSSLVSSNGSLSTTATSPAKTDLKTEDGPGDHNTLLGPAFPDLSSHSSTIDHHHPHQRHVSGGMRNSWPSADHAGSVPPLSPLRSHSQSRPPRSPRSSFSLGSSSQSASVSQKGHPQQQLPLMSPPTEERSGSLLDNLRSGQISNEDRASLLRAVHRQQGLAFGSDPRFSQSGFKAKPSVPPVFESLSDLSGQTPPSSRLSTNSQSTSEKVAAASEILRQMSQDGMSWTMENDSTKVDHPRTGGKAAMIMPMHTVSPSSESVGVSPDTSSDVFSGRGRVQRSASVQNTPPLGRKRTSSSANLADLAAEEYHISEQPQPAPSISKKSKKQSISGAVNSASPSMAAMSSGRSARSNSVSSSNERDNRELLSEAQRRKNHISSEKKRRDAIKQGFEELSYIVPVLRAGGFSKSIVLSHVLDFITDVEKKNKQMREILAELQRK
ncbi:hypothetical protein BZA70DRAFT_275138 [Myxozyma melibiosi]|uniref:BHLH domain-containing protein n=1 Tax=Myxozyma melibiosi TaxID=54550 RepID=A0ABR1FAF5_9ASCO